MENDLLLIPLVCVTRTIWPLVGLGLQLTRLQGGIRLESRLVMIETPR